MKFRMIKKERKKERKKEGKKEKIFFQIRRKKERKKESFNLLDLQMTLEMQQRFLLKIVKKKNNKNMK